MDDKEKKELYSIDSLVEDFMGDEGLTHHDYFKLQRWALRAVRELEFDVAGTVITTVINMDAKRQITLPLNYVDWTKLGISVEGKLRALAVKSSMMVNETDIPPTVLEGEMTGVPTGTDINAYGGYYFYNANGREIFAYGTGQNFGGHFKVYDKSSPKYIQFSSLINKQPIWLEYISDGIDVCGQTYVHPYVAEYIRRFMEHQYEKKRSGRSEASIRRTGIDLADQEAVVRARLSDLDSRSAMNIINKYCKLTPNG